MTLSLSVSDWVALFTHFLSLSLMAIGGAITTAPEMHRYLVDEQHWLSDSQFTNSIALAQAAPGPNLLFIALLGWNVGLNIDTGQTLSLQTWGYAMLGMSLCMLGILLPSTTLTFVAARWGHANREVRAVKAFKLGMAPIVIALLIATGWILASAHGNPMENWRPWTVTAIATILVWHTRIHLLWLLGAGGILGWFGWI
jgi:chromate transporter